MSAAVKCAACNDAGSLPGSHDLDCASCGVAVERVVFEAELPRIARTQAMRDALWSAYVMGKAAGAAQAVPDVCAEMRALCRNCGGTGDVHSIDGEWRGSCDCDAARNDGWTSVAGSVPPDTGTRYKVLAICAKKITDDPASPYCGMGIVGVYQDWNIRMWPANFTHWMPLPAAPKP